MLVMRLHLFGAAGDAQALAAFAALIVRHIVQVGLILLRKSTYFDLHQIPSHYLLYQAYQLPVSLCVSNTTAVMVASQHCCVETSAQLAMTPT